MTFAGSTPSREDRDGPSSPIDEPSAPEPGGAGSLHLTRRVRGGADDVWAVLFAPATMAAWMPGGAPGTGLRAGAPGTAVRVLEPRRHLRYTTHPEGWPHPSPLDVEVAPAGPTARVTFRQTAIPDADALSERRAAYEAVLDGLLDRFGTP